MAPADWKRRFTAPSIDAVTWARLMPHRLGVVSTENGSSQAWTWDLDSGERRLASTLGVGAEEVHALPDGSGVVWWHDETGDERGRWMVTPFDGGEPRPLLPEQSEGWMAGISLVPGAIAVGLCLDEDYVVTVRFNGAPAREVYRSAQPAGVGCEWPQGAGGLSADGAVLCILHAEKGDVLHPALRVLDAHTGETLGDQWDEELLLSPIDWSPVPGDRRLLFMHERQGMERPGIWDLAGGRHDVELAHLEGPVIPMGWFPDASALLLRHETTGVQRLLRYDVASGDLETVYELPGTISWAAFRPEGELWVRVESGEEPPSVRNVANEFVLRLPTEPPPAGRRSTSISFPNPAGQTIHGFVVTPPGPGPFPTIVSVHGGPAWHHTDDHDASTQAFVDHGFAVLLVNYRGSTGYGRAHREAIRGNIGFPESEDVVAALDHAIASGVADPERVFLEGWSWGGYLAMLNAGINPGRWRAIVAGIPTGDYVAAHYECAPPLRAWDLATIGGSPLELPELYRERNPMTYVDHVTAPMLVIAGEHDSRCPLGSVMVYVHALLVRGKPVEVHLYPGGHHANDVDEQIRHVELIVEFLRRHGG
jgi:dienelactone hydrolase